MTRCWFHIGMPKTGSTSIQETLYYELKDPDFVYCSFGEVNGSFALSSLVGHDTHIAAIRQPDGDRCQSLKHQRIDSRFQRCLTRARARGAALILSAELAYGWTRHQHIFWRQFAHDHGLDLRIVVYLRPPLDWLGSALAEGLKYARHVSQAQIIDHCLQIRAGQKLLYSNTLDALAELYGENALIVRPFLRDQMLGGCVVRDFCQVVGMRGVPDTIHRQNESLSLEASQCLHLRNISLGRSLQGSLDLLRREALMHQLERIFRDRPCLRLHPSVLGEALPGIQRHLTGLQERYGITLPLSTAVDGGGLTNLESLLALPVWARERLAAAAGLGSEKTAEQLLARLEQSLAPLAVLQAARRLLRRELRHTRVGC